MSERHRSTNWKSGRIQGTLFNRHLLFEQTLGMRSGVQDSDSARTTRKHALQPLASTGEIASPRSPSLRGPRRTKLRHRHAYIKDRTRCHNFTTQSPHEVRIAVGQKAWAPKRPSPSIRIVRMSRQALHFGVEEHWIAGTIIRVFNPAKTVADCFKFRNKIGVEVAIEALKESRKTKTTLDELWSAASVRGVTLTVLRSSS
jgi:hypothetical protein